MSPLNRRRFLGALSVSAAAVVPRRAGPAEPPPPAPPAPKPNFVVVLSDDLGYADLGCFGHPVIQTPNLDRLAQEGMKLTACYAAAPVCSPARAGMLTGRTPSRSGITDWIPAGSPMHLRRNEVTIAALLRQVGYATCHVGKWHCNGLFNRPEQPQPGDHGFDHWFSTQNNAAPSHRNPTNFIRNGQAVGPLTGYSSALIAQEAIEWLKGLPPKRPFCLFVWFHAPHEPIAAADEFTRLYPDATQPSEAEYCGDVTQMDHEVGRLLQALDGLKRRENTLVFFTSDNGPETLRRYRGAERSHGSPGPLRGMKLHLYEGGIRVPGILSWPGKTRPGQVCHEPVCGLDVLPTFCAMAGATVPTDRALDGASILPLFEGKPVERKTPLYWQYDHALGKPKVALRDGDWKLLAHADLKTFELYHLADDPAEKHDLAAQKPDLCRALAAKLLKLHADVQAERPTWPEAPSKKK